MTKPFIFLIERIDLSNGFVLNEGMYLKRLELVGFKSFASKTRLSFEPGMTAIVGPNGCGKSNVSDAVRWVLGEQRARVLRGAKMEDVIFNGTDSKKPLGLAEVSLTLADCSATLGVEYDEVCITRRVFRSGESGYFLNRKACRLKDIQRLFMDTGVGTDSYSILEQGKIDQILSSRPEDRRTVFEEASGITKYKADKKEALRKLEQTEANLLRLEDVIREVKRQIGSLQRQASKARRYKVLASEMRDLDLYVMREKLKTYSKKINECTGELQEVEREMRTLHSELTQVENRTQLARQKMDQLEEAIAQGREEVATLHGTLEHTRNVLSMNSDRIVELNALVDRNTQEVHEAQLRLVEENKKRIFLLEEIEKNKKIQSRAEEELNRTLEQQKIADETWRKVQTRLEDLRKSSLLCEQELSRQQHQLNELDAQDRTVLLKKERLATEKAELERTLALFAQQEESIEKKVNKCKNELEIQEERLNQLKGQQTELQTQRISQEKKEKETAKKRTKKQAQIEIFSESSVRQKGFPPGAQHLMNTQDLPVDLLGPIAEKITISPEYQTALEAVLRTCLDALIVLDARDAAKLLSLLEDQNAGSVRLLHLKGKEIISPTPPKEMGTPLLSLVTFPEKITPLVHRLLGGVYLIENTPPQKIPDGIILVSKSGVVLSNNQSELWMPSTKDTSPLARHQLCEQFKKELRKLEEQATRDKEELEATLSRIKQLQEEQAHFDEKREGAQRNLALQQGEKQVVKREFLSTQKRLKLIEEKIHYLLKNEGEGAELRNRLTEQLHTLNEKQILLRKEISQQTQTLSQCEQKRSEALTKTAEQRISYSEKSQTFNHLIQQQQPLEDRIRELNQLIRERETGIQSYLSRIEKLNSEMDEKQHHIAPLEEKLKETSKQLESNRKERILLQEALQRSETKLQELRTTLEKKTSQKLQHEIEQAEHKMRYENTFERIANTYHVTKKELDQLEPPTWNNGEKLPSCETIEIRIQEIQSKLSAMGPVNLVAIEEHAALEERYTFLNQQQNDLIAAKKQLLEMIQAINATTTDLFKKTFDLVNENFQVMFKKLFGGGSAKLVLTDETDVLESGIDIIARPPGKKLQTISLLSGGERTMTAVALLFSLFKVKPSPFCVLDELDAALDDANINRFVETLKEFLKDSQFIIITHSRQTIAAADVIYGVTMQTRGISKIVSMKFSDYHQTD